MSTVHTLRVSLQERGLSPAGNKDTLRKRLRKAQKSNASPSAPGPHEDAEQAGPGANPSHPCSLVSWAPRIHTFLVTDIEATCERGSPLSDPKQKFDYPNEIIEFPVLALCWNHTTREYVETARFHRFVRPSWRPTLSHFCRDLTGIEQSVLDAHGQPWAKVVHDLYHWLTSLGFLEQRNEHDPPDRFRLVRGVCWATHGPEDLASFVPKQSWISASDPTKASGAAYDAYDAYDLGRRGAQGLPPLWLRHPVLDVRKAFCQFTRLAGKDPRAPALRSHGRCARRDLTIGGMLAQWGMQFEGRPHSGMSDTQNIARILIAMAGWVVACSDPTRMQGQVATVPVSRSSSVPAAIPCTNTEAGVETEAKTENTAETETEAETEAEDGTQDAVAQLASVLEDTHLASVHVRTTNSTTKRRQPARQSSKGTTAVLHTPSVSAEEAEAAILRPNVEPHDRGPWVWMTRPGQVHWPYPPES